MTMHSRCGYFKRRSILRIRGKAPFFVVTRDAQTAVSQLVAPADGSTDHKAALTLPGLRAETCFICSKGARSQTWIPNVLAALASLDGAIVMDRAGRLLRCGRHPAASLDSRIGRDWRCGRCANDRGIGRQSIRSRAQGQ